MSLLPIIGCVATAVVGSPAVRSADAPDRQVLWQWKAADGLDDWRINGQIGQLRGAGRAVAFSTDGPDPIMEYVPHLDIPASAWQAVEVRMRADSEGLAELFWSGETKGQYGGFSGDKVTRFTVKGDNRWRTYRIYPFWQADFAHRRTPLLECH